jgi:ATP-dependent Lon protease
LKKELTLTSFSLSNPHEPQEINPAIRPAGEVSFDPLYKSDIEEVVKGAAQRLKINLEAGAEALIAEHTDEARKAVNILADSYGYVVSRMEGKLDRRKSVNVSVADVQEILQISVFPHRHPENLLRL